VREKKRERERKRERYTEAILESMKKEVQTLTDMDVFDKISYNQSQKDNRYYH